MGAKSPEGRTSTPLGVFRCRISGGQYHHAAAIPGDRLCLRREPDNPHDPFAILILNRVGDTLGYVPRRVARWLAPLMDERKIVLEPRMQCSEGTPGSAHETTIELDVSLTSQGARLLSLSNRDRDARQLLHRMLVRLWRRCRNNPHQPEMGREVALLLERLDPCQLLPESNLLLNLLPTVDAYRRSQSQRELAVCETQRRLKSLDLGDPLIHGNLVLIPLFGANGHLPAYDLLDDVLPRGQAQVDEIGEGSVPFLRVVNRSERPVLVCEGIILIAPKQNRVVNESILMPAATDFTLSVTCVEQGRWARAGAATAVSGSAHSRLRALKLQALQRSRQSGMAADAQCEVWSEVQDCLVDLGAQSPTYALNAAYAHHESRLETVRQALKLPPDTLGVIVASGDKIVGMEIMDHADSFRKVWDKLADGYFLQALRSERPSARSEPACGLPELPARWFINRVTEALVSRRHQTGLGVALEIDDAHITGSGVWYDGHLCQLSALAVEPAES